MHSYAVVLVVMLKTSAFFCTTSSNYAGVLSVPIAIANPCGTLFYTVLCACALLQPSNPVNNERLALISERNFADVSLDALVFFCPKEDYSI